MIMSDIVTPKDSFNIHTCSEIVVVVHLPKGKELGIPLAANNLSNDFAQPCGVGYEVQEITEDSDVNQVHRVASHLGTLDCQATLICIGELRFTCDFCRTRVREEFVAKVEACVFT